MIVELICFGNELLIGKTINTNANWIGKRITMLGSTLSRITTVPDNIDAMTEVLREALARKPNIIITTGGMGTTFDDMSLAAVAKALDKELVLSEEAVLLIKNRLKELEEQRGIELPFTEERKRMAYIPQGAKVLRNRAGSAPGVFVVKNNTKIFSVPGVPREMKSIFDHEIMSYFELDTEKQFFEKSIIVNHIPESELAAKINTTREKYPNVYVKTHPHSTTSAGGIIEVEIHLTAICSEENKDVLDKIQKEIVEVVKKMSGVKGQEPIIRLNNKEE